MPARRNTKSNSLRVQVHVRVPKLKPGASYKPGVFDEIVEKWWHEGDTGHRRIKVIAISWTRGGKRGGRETRPSLINSARERFQSIRGLTFTAKV